MAFIFDKSSGVEASKWVNYLGHISFLSYFILCFVYYQERMLNNDAAYYSFSVINNEDFFVKHSRYISYFTQWLPIAIAKLGGSLKAVLQSYSYIAGIYFYLLFLFTNYVLKNKWGGIFIIMCLVMTMRYKFYAGHTEITYAIAVASTLFVWLITDISSWGPKHHLIKWGGNLIFCALLYIIHPIIVIPLIMLLGYDFLVNRRWFDVWAYVNILTVVVCFAIRYYFVFKDGYESEKVGLISNFLEVIEKPQDYYVFEIMFHYIDHYIILMCVVFGLVLIGLLMHKKILDVLYFIACISALTVIIISTHSYLRSNVLIMIDGYIAMYGIIFALALFRLASLNELVKKYLIHLSAVILLICFVKIQKVHSFYENRLDQYKTLIIEQAQSGTSKIFLPYYLHDWDMFGFPYEIPLESLIISAIDPNVPQGTIFVDDKNKKVEKVLTRDYELIAFYTNFNLNHKFFKKDTTQYIEVLEVPWKD